MTKTEELQKVRRDMEEDKNLPLVTKPEDVVPGEGNPDAEIMFIGEAAGYHELVQRRPFVGVAGRLLTKTLEEIGMPRKDVYISNMVKTRPPENRDPLPEELAAFEKYLDREIEIINPKIIVTLGRFSMAKFIPGVTISQVHGQPRLSNCNGKQYFVYPMFHPAAALRAGSMMAQFKQDFQKLPEIVKMTLDDLIPPLVSKEEKEEKAKDESNQMTLI